MKGLLATLACVSLGLVACSPAHGDMKATYQRSESRAPALTIEVASNGDVRSQQGEDAYTLVHDGQTYRVLAGPGGPLVVREADWRAVQSNEAVDNKAVDDVVLQKRGPVVVNGRSGIGYALAGLPKEATPLVISNDPALEPVGRAFAQIWLSELAPPRASSAMASVLRSGTLLRMDELELQSVANTPIPPSRFLPPSPPLSLGRVRELFGSGSEEALTREEMDKSAINRAVFASGLLWLLTDSGRLMTVDLVHNTRADVALSGGHAIGLCRTTSGPAVVTADHGWTVWQRNGAAWVKAGSARSQGDTLAALTCSGNRIVLLTTSRLLELGTDGAFRATALSKKLSPSGVIVTTLETGSALFVGIDAGEWGGGLRRIARDGTVTEPARRSDKLCGGPLNPDCDPVNGIAPLPGNDDCVLVAIGLTHMLSHGRLASVCGTAINGLYFKPYTLDASSSQPESSYANTVPFYGLVQEPDGTLRAVGGDGLYRIAADRTVSFEPMPKFRTIDGISVADGVEGIVLVRTSINGRVSLSGAVPMIVAR